MLSRIEPGYKAKFKGHGLKPLDHNPNNMIKFPLKPLSSMAHFIFVFKYLNRLFMYLDLISFVSMYLDNFYVIQISFLCKYYNDLYVYMIKYNFYTDLLSFISKLPQ